MLGMGWKHAEATIVKRRVVDQSHVAATGAYSAQTFRKFEYIADVRPKDGSAPFRASLDDPFNQITFKQPEEGQVVLVKYKEKGNGEHEVKFDRADDGTYDRIQGVPDWRRHEDPAKARDKEAVAAAHTDQAQSEWDAALSAPAGAQAPPTPQPAADGDLAAHEQELYDLLTAEDERKG